MNRSLLSRVQSGQHVELSFLFGSYTLKAIKSCHTRKYELIIPKLGHIVWKSKQEKLQHNMVN